MLIIISLIIASLFFDNLYVLIYGHPSDSFFVEYQGAAEYVFVFALSYIFSLLLFFTAFGDSNKYWWIGILLIPAAAFEIFFDWQHIYIPIILGLAGWIIGYGISKLIPKKI
jgi:hypothetical protein